MKTAESSKAKYFLNKARKAILAETARDKLHPTLKITAPSEGTVTNRFSVTMTGEAADDYFVSELSVNGQPVMLELAAKRVPLKKELTLKRGSNVFKVIASDLTGKSTVRTLKITVDREGPVIVINEQETIGRKIVLSGFLSDSTGVASFSINDKKVPLHHKPGANLKSGGSRQEVAFHQEIDLPEGIDTVTLEAEDMADNVTRGEISLVAGRLSAMHLPTPAQYPGQGGPLMLAFNDALKVGSTYTDTGVQYAMREGATPVGTPAIHLKNLAESQTVYDNAFYLEGSISSDNEIRSLAINGEPILKRSGKRVFFSHFTGLMEGENRFAIEAVDAAGNRAQRVITVIRRIQKIRRIGSRMSVSVLPLEHKGEQSVAGDAVYDNFVSALVNQKRFRVVERANLKAVLRELSLSQTGLTDQRNASRVGKIIVADAILTGTIYEGKDSIEVRTRLVNTETSAIMGVEDVFTEDKSLPGIKGIMGGLALKFKQSFPVLEGLVIDTKDKT
ncbi:MAG: hypothetical protein KAR06_05960, partial [Deltaproteobacteria bacterium]|nr:hypothetical protein [Deltaproteobacteria bacterium]